LNKLTFSKWKISKWAVFENLVSANNSITVLKKIFIIFRVTIQPAQPIYLNADVGQIDCAGWHVNPKGAMKCPFFPLSTFAY